MKIRHYLRKIKRCIIPNKLMKDISLSKRIHSSKELYKNAMKGKILNIENPLTFTEKVRWYELFYYTPEMSKVVDKYLFKQYIKEHLGENYTIELFGMWTSISDLKKDWDKLPEEFVLKSNICDSGKNIKVIHRKSDVVLDLLIVELKEWLNPFNTLLNSYCNAYYATTPRIIAERYCENVANQLYDFKLFCFNGEPYCFYVATGLHIQSDMSYPIGFYDLNWNQMDVQYGEHPKVSIPKPKHLEEMKKIARKLSKPFPFVRVDFFETEEKLYMAEMTFYPGGGLTPYHPESFDSKLGEMFQLPNNITVYKNGKFQSQLHTGE